MDKILRTIFIGFLTCHRYQHHRKGTTRLWGRTCGINTFPMVSVKM